MLSAHQLVVFVPAALLVGASPGANNLLALRHGAGRGTAAAVLALSGRAVAFLIMVALMVAGLTAVLVRSQSVFTAVRVAGAGYLLLLAVRALLASRRDHADAPLPETTGGRWQLARREFTVAAANPKALLLFTAFVPQFVDASHPPAGQLLVLGPLYVAIELVAACGWAAAGGRLGALGMTARARRWFDRVTGLTFLGLSASVAATSRP